MSEQMLPLPELTCPCGRVLEQAAELAYGVCDECRVTAHKQVRKRPPKPDFTDVPLPGLEDWGVNRVAPALPNWPRQPDDDR